MELGMPKKKMKAIKGSIPHKEQNELRANLLKLSEGCPFHLANPEDCPLFALRRMKPAKRLEWINALSGNDLVYLATYHRVCLRMRRGSSRR